MQRRIVIERDRLEIEGHTVDRARPVAWFAGVVGRAPRTEVPEIARGRPVQTNRFHVFDDEGIFLTDHHADEEVACPPHSAFDGELFAFGVRLRGGETEANVTALGLDPDHAFVHRWTFDAPATSVHLAFIKRRTRFGKRGGPHRLASVSFGFAKPELLAARARSG